MNCKAEKWLLANQEEELLKLSQRLNSVAESISTPQNILNRIDDTQQHLNCSEEEAIITVKEEIALTILSAYSELGETLTILTE